MSSGDSSPVSEISSSASASASASPSPSTPSDPFAPLPVSFYRRPAEAVARDLLGRYLVRCREGSPRLVLRLVETEAYLGRGDAASHARNGPATERARRLFRDGGHAYVYLIYGVHHCLNVTAATADDGMAVLLRAGAVVEGEATMVARRSLGRAPRPGDVAGGPGKLCQALGVDRDHDGLPLWRPDGELILTAGEPVADRQVARGPRIGVDYAGEAATWPLRFAVAGHPEMSRPRLG